MLGKILDFSIQSGVGVITTDDGGRYIFSTAEWKQPEAPIRGQEVDFDVNDEGLAIQVFLALKETASPAHEPEAPSSAKHLWLAIVSVILGVLTVLALFDESPWDIETIIGMVLLSGFGLALGIVTLANKYAGKGLAIAGVITNAISVLASLGLLST